VKPKAFCLLASLVLLGFLGCRDDKTPSSNLPTTQITVGHKTYTLEIAADEEVRRKGLMQRDSMPKDHGMIFLFADEANRSFWMHNTRIPLDILYLNAAGRVVSIHRMEPYVEELTPSKGPAKYAIELNAGEAEAAGAKEGQLLELPASVKATKADP
jgi:uncharacterized membrane protein (UPF0127 family)